MGGVGNDVLLSMVCVGRLGKERGDRRRLHVSFPSFSCGTLTRSKYRLGSRERGCWAEMRGKSF
jgi:hypothetical protein